MKFNTINKILFSTFVASVSAYDLLKDYAGDLKVGVAANTNKFNNANYNNAMKAFNMMVAENGCKLSGIQQQKGVYNFNDCDAHYNKAKELGMEFRGHCLIWHSWQPSWFENADANTLKNAIIDHVTKTLQHYEGKIKAWDVVNDAVDDNSNGNGFMLRNSFLRQKVPDFIDIAFQTARKVSPNTKLFYNDYNAEGHLPKSESIYNFVADLKKRNIPIDGVGLQYHVSSQSQPTFQQINGLIGRYCKLGLEVHITELDVKLQGNQSRQTEAFSNALKACLANSCCKAFLVWGVGDNDSWLGGSEQALLFNNNYQPKPIYNTLLDILKKEARPASSSSSNDTSSNSAPSNNSSGNKATKTVPSNLIRTKTIPSSNNSPSSGNTTKTVPTNLVRTKTIPNSLKTDATSSGNKTKTIPKVTVPGTKTIPASLAGGSGAAAGTKTVPNSLNRTKTIPTSINSKTKTIPNVSSRSKTIPSGSNSKTIPQIALKSKTIPPDYITSGGSGSTKTVPSEHLTGQAKTKTIPSNVGSKTIPTAAGSKTIPSINKTKTIPSINKTKTIPSINKTKTIPSGAGSSSKTIPSINKTKTIPSGAGNSSKTIPSGAGSSSKTIPSINKTKTIPSGAGNSSKTIPSGAGSSSKTIPSVNKTKTIPSGAGSSSKTIPSGAGNSSKTIPSINKTKTIPSGAGNSSKTIPSINKTKTIPSVNKTKTIPTTVNGGTTKTIPSSGNDKCEAKTVTVTVTVEGKCAAATNANDANCVPKWGQCGGNNYSGPTCCQSGSTCKEFNEWYHQCV